jgi:hypothetical protein
LITKAQLERNYLEIVTPGVARAGARRRTRIAFLVSLEPSPGAALLEDWRTGLGLPTNFSHGIRKGSGDDLELGPVG